MKQSHVRRTARTERWLVVSAWPPELAFLRTALTTLPDRVRRRVRLSSVGVGLVEAAVGTTRVLAEHDVDAVILVGTAGVYPNNEVPLGQACLVARAVLLPHLWPGSQAFLPAVMPHACATTPALTRRLSSTAPGRPTLDVACPLAITSSGPAARSAAKRTGCALENLEAFAVARAAQEARLPFAAVLGVTNHVGPHGHRQWIANGKQAAENACRVVLAALRA